MKTTWIFFFCFSALAARAGRSYTLQATRGNIIISNSSTRPALQPGDTLFVPATAKYNSVQYQHLNGDSSNNIVVIWLPGSQISSPKQFQSLSNFDVRFVLIENMLHDDFYGVSKFSYAVHDLRFRHCRWINPKGSYKDQPCQQWDDPDMPARMVFAGKKFQTFYNISYQDCFFDGFRNANVVQVSTNWNTGTPEIKRSMALDITFTSDTFQNITNTYPATVAAIAGTGFGCQVRHCVFKNILGAGSVQNSHSASITWYGSIEVSECLQENSYAQLLRSCPLGWSGLPGYLEPATACRAWRNIIHNNLSYSAFEFNQNLGGNRNKENGLFPIKAVCLHNTVYRTKRNSYNGPYYGFVVDIVNQDSLECSFNLIIAPEYDYPFDTSRKYIVAIVSSKPKQLVAKGNKAFKKWDKTILRDTIGYEPGPALKLTGGAASVYSFIKTDFYGRPLPSGRGSYAGAVESGALLPGKKTKD